MVPGSASGRGRSARTATERRRAWADTALARYSARGGLRQLVRSSRVGAGVPSRAGKVGGEPRQVGGRRAAPAVDRLDRIADRGQGQFVVDSAAEQRRQRDALRVTGVLVFVEQHDPVPVAQLLADLRERRRQAGGRGHLHAEVHHLLGAHAPVQRVDQRHELGAFGLGGQHPQQPLARAAVTLIRAGRQGVHEPFQLDVGVAQLLGVDEVLGQLAGQPQHHRRHGGRRLVGVEVAGMLAHDAKRQLPQLGFAQQPGIGLDRAAAGRARAAGSRRMRGRC